MTGTRAPSTCHLPEHVSETWMPRGPHRRPRPGRDRTQHVLTPVREQRAPRCAGPPFGGGTVPSAKRGSCPSPRPVWAQAKPLTHVGTASVTGQRHAPDCRDWPSPGQANALLLPVRPETRPREAPQPLRGSAGLGGSKGLAGAAAWGAVAIGPSPWGRGESGPRGGHPARAHFPSKVPGGQKCPAEQRPIP